MIATHRLPLTAPVVGGDSLVRGLEGDWIRLSNHLAYIRSQKEDAVSHLLSNMYGYSAFDIAVENFHIDIKRQRTVASQMQLPSAVLRLDRTREFKSLPSSSLTFAVSHKCVQCIIIDRGRSLGI